MEPKTVKVSMTIEDLLDIRVQLMVHLQKAQDANTAYHHPYWDERIAALNHLLDLFSVQKVEG